MDDEAMYLALFGVQEHRPAAATSVINRMIAGYDDRWCVYKMANR